MVRQCTSQGSSRDWATCAEAHLTCSYYWLSFTWGFERAFRLRSRCVGNQQVIWICLNLLPHPHCTSWHRNSHHQESRWFATDVRREVSSSTSSSPWWTSRTRTFHRCAKKGTWSLTVWTRAASGEGQVESPGVRPMAGLGCFAVPWRPTRLCDPWSWCLFSSDRTVKLIYMDLPTVCEISNKPKSCRPDGFVQLPSIRRTTRNNSIARLNQSRGLPGLCVCTAAEQVS